MPTKMGRAPSATRAQGGSGCHIAQNGVESDRLLGPLAPLRERDRERATLATPPPTLSLSLPHGVGEGTEETVQGKDEAAPVAESLTRACRVCFRRGR